MKWLRMVLKYAPEVVSLGKDVRELVEGQKYDERVLKYIAERLGRHIADTGGKLAKLELRVVDLERRVENAERHA